MKSVFKILIIFFLFYLCGCSHTQKLQSGDYSVDEKFINYYNYKDLDYKEDFTKITSREILDSFHQFGLKISEPSELLNLIKSTNNNNRINDFIEVLETPLKNGKKENAIALFSYYYWKMVKDIYMQTDTEFKNGSIILKIPVNSIRNYILSKLENSQKYLTNYQVTAYMDYEESFKDINEIIYGKKETLINSFNESAKSLFQTFTQSNKENECAYFLFSDNPASSDIFKRLSDAGKNIDKKYKKYLRSYRIYPDIKVNNSTFPITVDYSLSASSEGGEVVPCVLPTPFINIENRNKYLPNLVNAFCGALLLQGTGKELVILAKLEQPSHGNNIFTPLFNKMIDSLTSIGKKTNAFSVKANSEDIISDSNYFLGRVFLIPQKYDCDNINNINNKLKTAIENFSIQVDSSKSGATYMKKNLKEITLFEYDKNLGK